MTNIVAPNIECVLVCYLALDGDPKKLVKVKLVAVLSFDEMVVIRLIRISRKM